MAQDTRMAAANSTFQEKTISSFPAALYLQVQKPKIIQVKGVIAETRCS